MKQAAQAIIDALNARDADRAELGKAVNTQPAALHYAEVLENFYLGIGRMDATGAAAELRRLHEANQELLEALKEVMNYAWCDWDSSSRPHFDRVYGNARVAAIKHGGAA
jgi:hypothetical protein